MTRSCVPVLKNRTLVPCAILTGVATVPDSCVYSHLPVPLSTFTAKVTWFSAVTVAVAVLVPVVAALAPVILTVPLRPVFAAGIFNVATAVCVPFWANVTLGALNSTIQPGIAVPFVSTTVPDNATAPENPQEPVTVTLIGLLV